VNPIREMITDDFSIRLTNRDTNDFARRIKAAANGIPYESLTQRRQPKRQCTIPLNRHIQYMDQESVSSTSSSGSDSLSAAEPHPEVIDLSDPGGWNSHRESQALLFGTRKEDWNHIPYSFLPPVPMDKTNLSEEFLTTITCPLPLELFTDPIVGKDGHTYERGWIEKHLKEKQTSPMTRQPMQPHSLVSNIALCNIIEDKISKVQQEESTTILGQFAINDPVFRASGGIIMNPQQDKCKGSSKEDDIRIRQ